MIAVILMGAGVCLVGVLSGMVAGWFLSPAAQKAEAEREELKMLIGQLREQVAATKAATDLGPSSQ